MAKTSSVTASINVEVNEQNIREQVKKIIKESQEEINKNLLQMKIVLDKSGKATVVKELKQLQDSASHGIIIGFAPESWDKMGTEGQKYMSNVMSSLETEFKKEFKNFKGFSMFLGDAPIGIDTFKKNILENVKSLKGELGEKLTSSYESAVKNRTMDSYNNLLATVKMVKKENDRLDSIMESMDSSYNKEKNYIKYREGKEEYDFNDANRKLLWQTGMKAYPNGIKLKSEKEAIFKLINEMSAEFEGRINNIDVLGKLLKGEGIPNQNVKIDIEPADMEKFSSKITEYTKANPVKVIIDPEVKEGFELKIDNATVGHVKVDENDKNPVNENNNVRITSDIYNTDTASNPFEKRMMELSNDLNEKYNLVTGRYSNLSMSRWASKYDGNEEYKDIEWIRNEIYSLIGDFTFNSLGLEDIDRLIKDIMTYNEANGWNKTPYVRDLSDFMFFDGDVKAQDDFVAFQEYIDNLINIAIKVDEANKYLDKTKNGFTDISALLDEYKIDKGSFNRKDYLNYIEKAGYIDALGYIIGNTNYSENQDKNKKEKTSKTTKKDNKTSNNEKTGSKVVSETGDLNNSVLERKKQLLEEIDSDISKIISKERDIDIGLVSDGINIFSVIDTVDYNLNELIKKERKIDIKINEENNTENSSSGKKEKAESTKPTNNNNINANVDNKEEQIIIRPKEEIRSEVLEEVNSKIESELKPVEVPVKPKLDDDILKEVFNVIDRIYQDEVRSTINDIRDDYDLNELETFKNHKGKTWKKEDKESLFKEFDDNFDTSFQFEDVNWKKTIENFNNGENKFSFKINNVLEKFFNSIKNVKGNDYASLERQIDKISKMIYLYGDFEDAFKKIKKLDKNFDISPIEKRVLGKHPYSNDENNIATIEDYKFLDSIFGKERTFEIRFAAEKDPEGLKEGILEDNNVSDVDLSTIEKVKKEYEDLKNIFLEIKKRRDELKNESFDVFNEEEVLNYNNSVYKLNNDIAEAVSRLRNLLSNNNIEIPNRSDNLENWFYKQFGFDVQNIVDSKVEEEAKKVQVNKKPVVVEKTNTVSDQGNQGAKDGDVKEIKVKLVPSVVELITDINKISNDEHPIKVKADIESLIKDIKDNLKNIPVSLDYENEIDNLRADIEYVLDGININIGGLNYNNTNNNNNIVANIYDVLKKISEAENITQQGNGVNKDGDSNNYGVERSIFLDSKTGKFSNPFIVGLGKNVPGYIIGKQKKQLDNEGVKYDSYLHTHPYPSSNIYVPTPSGQMDSSTKYGIKGDLAAFVTLLQQGITNQFIATTKEVLRVNLEGINKDSAVKIFKDDIKLKEEYKNKLNASREASNTDYVISLFDSNKYYFEDIINNIVNKNSKYYKDVNTENIYYELNKYINDALSGFLGQKFDANKMLDIDKIKNIISKNSKSSDNGVDFLANIIYREFSKDGLFDVNSLYNNTLFSGYNKVLQDLFVKNGFGTNRVQTYSLDEFKKIFGQTSDENTFNNNIGSMFENIPVSFDYKAAIGQIKTDLEALLKNIEVTPVLPEAYKLDINGANTKGLNAGSSGNPNVENHTVPVDLIPNAEKLRTDVASITGVIANVDGNINQIESKINSLNGKEITLDLKTNPDIEYLEKKINSIVNLKGSGVSDKNIQELENKTSTSTENMNNSFDRVTTNVESNAKRQIKNIQEIIKVVDELTNKLKEIGTPTIKDLDKVMKAASNALNSSKTQDSKAKTEQLKVEQQALKVEQEKVKLKQEEYKLQQQIIALENKKKEGRNRDLDYQNKELERQKKEIDLQNKMDKAQRNNQNDSNDKDSIDIQSTKEFYDQLIEASNKTKDFKIDENSFKVGADGAIKFTATIKDMGNYVMKATYSIEDLTDAINDAGELDVDFLNSNAVKVNTEKVRISNDRIEQQYNKFTEMFRTYNKDNILEQMILGEDGNPEKLTNYIEKIITDIQTLNNELMNGTYSSSEKYKQDYETFKSLIYLFGQLTDERNLKNKGTGKKSSFYIGEFDYDSDLSNAVKNQQEELKERIKKIYYSQGYKNISFKDNFNPGNNTIGAVLEKDGYFKNVILELRQIQDEAGKTVLALNEVYKSGGKKISAGEKWFSGLKAKIVNLTQYVTGIDVVMRIWNQIQQGISFVAQLDASLTTINQTMNTTKEELTYLGKGAIEVGRNFGATSDSVLEASAIYANTTETAASVLEKAKPTMLLANASGQDISTVANQIQGVINQFKELEGQETRIVNSYEKISAGLAINFADGINIMSEAVQNAGSIVESAGMQFETYAASVGKISERTRQDGSVIGNAYKTIMARMSRSKSADEDVTNEDRSNAAKAYKTVGIELYDEKGQYKDINETLDELSSKWNTLTDAQRNYISEQSAGVRNVNTFNALIETWQDAKNLAKSASEDTDFYMSVQEKHMESIQGKINSIQATMQGFWESFISSDSINIVLTGLDVIVTTLEKIGGFLEKIGNFTGSGIIAQFLGIGITGIAATSLFDNIRSARKTIGDDAGIIDVFGYGIKQTGKDIVEIFKTAKTGFSAFIEGFKNGKGLIDSFTSGITSASNATSGLSVALGGLVAGIFVVNVLTKSLDYFATSAKESKEAVETANNAYSTQIEKQKEMRSTIDSIGSEWQKLSAGVDSNGNNISLTNDEFERYHDLCNQIAQVIPNVVSRYDEQGNAVLSLKGKMTELNAEYEKIIQQQARTRYNENFDTYATELKNRNGNMGFLDRIWSLFTGAKYSETEGNQEIVDALKTIQNSTYDESLQYFMHMGDDAELNRRNSEINQLLGTSGVITEEEFNALKINGTIQQAIDNQQQDLKDAANNVKQSIQDYITSVTTGDGKYASMDDNVVAMATQAINNSSDELISSFADNKIALETEVNNWLSALQDNPEAQNVLSNILGINEDTSIEELKSYMQSDLDILSDALGIDDDGIKELKIQLKLEGKDELIKSYDEIVDTAAIKLQEEGKKQLDSISKTYKNNLTDIDLYNRPVVLSYEMNKHGWKTDDGTYSTYFSDIKNELDENGNIEKSIVFTPIYKDEKGNEKVLTPDEFEKETERILAGGEDTKGLKIAEFDSKDYKDSAKAAGKFAERLHKASDYYDLLEEDAGRVKDFIEDNNINTKEQIGLLNSLMDKYGNWSDVMANWGFESFDLEVNADSLDALESNLGIVKEKIGEIQEAYKESITSSGMTKETIETIVSAFSDLDGYNYDKLFESTASGVHMNAQELAKMNAQYEKREKSKYQDKLKEEIAAYEDICVAIEEANTLSEKQSLIRKRDGLAEQIQQTNELISKYEGLTNAVTKYQQALEMGEEGDVYDSIVSGYENAKELWEKGLVGTNEFKSFTQMFSSEDLSTASVDEYVKAWESAQTKITRWMTEDSSGVENFLYDIQAVNAEWAKFDGTNWDLTGLPDMETMSKNLGVSESLIDSMMKKLHDYGFTINFTEAKDNLRYMLNDAKEANKYLSGFANSGLNAEDLDKLKVDAETLDKLKNFNFDISVSDPKALDEQIDIAQKLRIALSDAYGEGSEKVEYFDKQLDYIIAKRGELTTMSNIDIAGLSIGLDMEKDAETLDEIIKKLTTIQGFTGITLKFKTGDIDAVNSDLSIIEGKINALSKDESGKINLDTEGATELLELYTSLLNEKAKVESTSNVISNADVAKLKSVAEQDAIKYLQAYQDAVSEYKVAVKINDKFGKGTIDTSNIENNVITALSNIQNAGTDVQKIFENLYIDMSKIDLSNLSNTINGFNGEINEITEADYSGMGGSFTIVNNQLKMLKNSAEDAKDVLNDKSLNLEVFTTEDIQAEIANGEEFLSTLDSNSAGAKALGDQLDYLRKKEELLGSTEGLNLSLNYESNKAVLDNTVKGLKDIEKYKDLEINFDTNSIDKVDGQITTISNELTNLKDPNTGKIDFTQTGAAELMDIMIALYNQKQLLTNDHRSYMNVDTAGVTDSQKSAIENIQRLQNSMDQLDQVKFIKQFIPDIDTSIAEQAVTDAWKTIQNGTEKEKQVYANLGIEPGKINVDDNKINDETQKAIQDQLDPIDCEVLVNAGYDIKNVTKLTEDLDQLKEKYNVDIDIDWENLDPEYISGKIEDLKKQLEDLRGEDGIVKIGEDGYEEAREIMLTLIRLKQQAEGNVVLGVDTSQLEKETKLAIEDLQNVMNAYQELQALKDLQSSGIEIDTSELDDAQTKLDGFVTDFVNAHPTTAATVGLAIKEGDETKIVEDVNAALSGITANMLVEAGVDSTLVDGYVPEDKNATVTYNIDKSAVTNFLNSNIDKTGTVVWRNDTSSLRHEFTAAGIIGGGAKINGTAYAGGTSGKWGAKKDETALVGEVSPELSVDPKTGRWELLGANGAEFRKIRKGQIIFNGKQTEEIFRNGKINSRGKAFVNGTIDKINSLFKVRSGTAYAYGSYGGSGGSFGRFYKNSKFYSNASVDSGSKNDKAEDEFKDSIDLIEIMIDRLERKINELDTIASSTYKSFTKRNNSLSDEFGEVTKEIELQQKAYEAYIKKANSIGLDPTWAKRIRDGELSIKDITDENLKKKIDEYQQW